MRFEKGEKYSQKVDSNTGRSRLRLTIYATQTDAELAPILVLTNPITH